MAGPDVPFSACVCVCVCVCVCEMILNASGTVMNEGRKCFI